MRSASRPSPAPLSLALLGLLLGAGPVAAQTEAAQTEAPQPPPSQSQPAQAQPVQAQPAQPVQAQPAQPEPTQPPTPQARATPILLPIDSRPATSTLPAQIAGLLGPVAVPPAELLGTAKQGADPARLMAWLEAQPTGGPLIVSLDALAYGGLVQSRSSRDPLETVLARLQPLREWQARTGGALYAFIVLPRQPDAVDRARNLAVAREMVGWARQGVFRELHVSWDDALPGSPSPAEGAALAQDAPPNVLVYPGADEVLGNLVALSLSPQAARLAVEYSQPDKADAVIRYEGIPLARSVALHAAAAGWTLAPTVPEVVRTPFGGQGERPLERAELTLYVYNGGDARAAALRVSQLLRRGPLAVADVERVNSGNPRVWADLYTLQRPQDLASLAAWGTPGNNLGTVLAHAKVLLAAQAGGAGAGSTGVEGTGLEATGGEAGAAGSEPAAPTPAGQDTAPAAGQSGSPDVAARQDALLAREYANDVVYNSALRPRLRTLIPDARLPGSDAPQQLLELAQRYFPLHFKSRYTLSGADFPWERSFEVDLKLSPQK